MQSTPVQHLHILKTKVLFVILICHYSILGWGLKPPQNNSPNRTFPKVTRTALILRFHEIFKKHFAEKNQYDNDSPPQKYLSPSKI